MNINLKHTLFLVAVFTWLSSELIAQGYYGTHFRHEVTVANSSGIVTYIDHEELNNNPDAIFVAAANLEPNGIPVGYKFSLSYEVDMAKWAFRYANGQSSFPIGSTFNVLIPSANGSSFRTVSPGGDSMFLMDHPAINGNVNRKIFINPIYPGYTIGNGKGEFIVSYLPSPFNKWGISRTPTFNIQAGETFNVFVADDSDNTFVHRVSDPNKTTSISEIDHPLLNENPNANFIFQRRFTFQNNASTTYNNRTKSAAYINGKWHIEIDDGNKFFHNEDFNIAVLNIDATGLFSKNSRAKHIELHPNPANQKLNITWEEANGKPIAYDIFDVSGRLVFSGNIPNGSEYEVDVKPLPDGIYFIQIQSDTKLRSGKFIVAH